MSTKLLLREQLGSSSAFIRGAEQGFNERADVIRAADGTDLNEFWAEVNATIAIRNARRDTIVDALSFRVTGVVDEVTPPSEVDFERATEFGQPVGIRANATRLFRGFDFAFFDLGVRFTWMALAEMDRNQLQMQANLAIEADKKLFFKRVMERLFYPLNSNGFTDKNEPVTVFAAYNGDGEVPPRFKSNTFSGSHNHYLISGNTAVTPANLDTLATSVGEHGYTMANGYKLVLWVNKTEADIISTFRVTGGAKFDFVANPALYGGAVFVPNNGTYVGGPTGTVPGEIGTYGPFHVVQEEYIPSGYIACIATGGPDNISNPIGIREHTNPAYQGLKVIPGQRSDYPLVDSFYRRGLGTGIRHRGAITLMQVKASGNYAVPALYDPAAA